MKKSLIQSVEKYSSEIEKNIADKKKKAKKDMKRNIILMTLGFVLIWAWSYSVYSFTEKYKIQSPIILKVQPLIIRRDGKVHKTIQAPVKSQIMAPVVEAKELEEKEYKTAEIFDAIWMLESTKGTAPEGHHIYCRSIGKWNEIGYGNRQKLCFEDIEEARLTIENWFKKRGSEGMDLATSLCYYNTGYKQPNCTYYQHYLTL